MTKVTVFPQFANALRNVTVLSSNGSTLSAVAGSPENDLEL